MSVSNRNYLLRTEAAIQTPTMRSAYPPRAAMVVTSADRLQGVKIGPRSGHFPAEIDSHPSNR